MYEIWKDSTERDMIRRLDCYSAHLIKWLFICGLIFPLKMFWSCKKNSIMGCQLQHLHQKIGSFQVWNTNVILAAENHFNTHPPLKCGVLSNWKWWEAEPLHSAAAILCKLREVAMCNYHSNSQFNSHNRTVVAVTSQQRPLMEVHICKDRTDEARRVIFKKALWADIRQLIHGGG